MVALAQTITAGLPKKPGREEIHQTMPSSSGRELNT
jgi:hypothetical protein